MLYGDQVYALRLESGMSQVDLAARAGCGVYTLQRIESGDDGVLLRTLARVSEALDASLTVKVRRRSS